jgi:hypothetical protein
MIEILVHSILADKYEIFICFYLNLKYKIRIYLSWEMFYHEDYPETKLNGTKFYNTIFSFRNRSWSKLRNF